MSTGLIPQSCWFRLSIPCARIEGLPRQGETGRLLDLPASCSVVNASTLEGHATWSDVRVAWNPGGLAVQVEIVGKKGSIRYDSFLAEASDGVLLWIDTRDTRDVHRATRFCHRFSAVLKPEKGGKSVNVVVEQKPIHRALADAPLAKPAAIRARAEKTKDGWRIELFFAASALNGFDPDTNRRLGFAYQVTDPQRGSQYLTVGRDFPIAEDPSLWSTLELIDAK